ncbi:MAG: energy-coupling factor transporter transmembrane component T [Candidatus Bathyarchaeia archaeon]
MKLLYQFAARDSFLHNLDPRTKLLIVACHLVAVLLVQSYLLLAGSFLFMMLLLWLGGRISPREYGTFLVLLMPLVSAITLIQAFFNWPPSAETINIGLLKLSIPGILLGLKIGLILATMGITFAMFSMTTDPYKIGVVLYKVGIPFNIAFMTSFSLRLLPLLQEELQIIGNAAKLRAYGAFDSRNPAKGLTGLVHSIVPLMISSLKRSRDIALAMELRHLNAPRELGIARTFSVDVLLRRRDYAIIAFSILYLTSVLYLHFAPRL